MPFLYYCFSCLFIVCFITCFLYSRFATMQNCKKLKWHPLFYHNAYITSQHSLRHDTNVISNHNPSHILPRYYLHHNVVFDTLQISKTALSYDLYIATFIPNNHNSLHLIAVLLTSYHNTLDNSSNSSHHSTFHISHCKYKNETTKKTD